MKINVTTHTTQYAKQIAHIKKMLPTTASKNYFVAGGTLTSTFTNKPVNDIDIYPKSQDAMYSIVEGLFEDGWWCTSLTQRAITFVNQEEIPVQVMLFGPYPTAESIFEKFDFTVCMAALDVSTEELHMHETFVEDLASRSLYFYHGTMYPYASSYRVKKYTERGYKIGRFEYQKILLACAMKPIGSWDDLKEQLGGVYGEILCTPKDDELGEFSFERAFEVMNDISVVDGHSNVDCPKVVCFEDFVKAVCHDPVNTVKHEGDYTYRINGSIYVDSDGPNNPVIVPFEELGIKFYKKVLVKEETLDVSTQTKHITLCAGWDTSFEFKVGEYFEQPKYPHIHAKNHLLHAEQFNIKNRDKLNTVIVEVEVDSPDDLYKISELESYNEVHIKRGKITRIVSDEEIEAVKLKHLCPSDLKLTKY